MQIVCPKCQFARELPDDKVPANAKVATCPRCKIKFQFRELPDEAAAPAAPPARPAGTPPAAGTPPPPASAPPLPGSRQAQAPGRVGLRPPTAPGDPGEGIWNRLEAMPPGAVPPAFDPDTAAPSRHGSPAPGFPPGVAAGRDRSQPAGPAQTHRLIKNPLEEAAEAEYAAEQAQEQAAEQAQGEPGFLRYTRRNTGAAQPSHASQTSQTSQTRGAAEDFAQPSYMRDHQRQQERGGRHNDVPWEHPREHGGWLKALVATSKAVLFAPSSFFRHMPVGGGVSKPLIFAMLMGTFQALITLIYQEAGLSISLNDDAGMSQTALAAVTIGLVVAMPLLIAIGLCIHSFFTTLALRVFKAAGNGYEGTFRAMAYGTAVSLCTIIPFVGPVIGGIWGFVLMFISLKNIHGTSYGRVILAVLFVIVLVAVLFAVLGMLLALGLGVGLSILGGGA
ncbi:YIP1 family protein [Megalodesulfovibrio gigas]|uniref:Yip1 domain-containing protein n=1 Tax=Megalodesulfovibrio gigas (strain ATCC 19364 / DSM 1382 / NCIMB 9332 / VKM B-1759) TaxID=1121448 RepID=T2GFC9_MEGG1|nr:YIP1 family protein [Megalodesulfovibrio gigas]AGW14597.1 hypothetical protein DGI_2870 [Megalodesulfovibrio gigas DSM 1382 = ATCC 19364]